VAEGLGLASNGCWPVRAVVEGHSAIASPVAMQSIKLRFLS